MGTITCNAGIGRKIGLQFPLHANTAEPRLSGSPEQFRLAGKIPEQRHFIDLRKMRDVTRARALIPVPGEQLHRRLDDANFRDTFAGSIFHKLMPLLDSGLVRNAALVSTEFDLVHGNFNGNALTDEINGEHHPETAFLAG